jgi:hypothetical protein
MNQLTTQQIWLARGIAMAADAVQMALFPIFGEGFASPANLALDLVMTAVLTKLIGWHIAFLPTIAMELLPIADLAPSWTLAVLVATRGREAKSVVEGEPIRVHATRRS